MGDDATLSLVDGDDFLLWQSEFGTSTTAATAAVPEPHTAVLALMLGLAAFTKSRAR